MPKPNTELRDRKYKIIKLELLVTKETDTNALCGAIKGFITAVKATTIIQDNQEPKLTGNEWMEKARSAGTCCVRGCEGIGENHFPYCDGHDAP